MEIISDNSFDDNQSNGSSCMSSYSSDISEQNEIPDELLDEARASKRKLDWEERFKRFEEMDRMSGADNEYDIRDEDQMTKFALEVNEADSQSEKHSTVGDEKDYNMHISDTVTQHTFSTNFEFEEDGTTCYYAEDDNSGDSDKPSYEKTDGSSSYSAIHEFKNSSMKHLEQNNQPVDNYSMLNIEKGQCTKCDTMICFPQYLKTSNVKVSENLMCERCDEIYCMIKETGHDDCMLQDCLTCREFVEMYKNIENCRRKLHDIQRMKASTEQSTTSVVNTISRNRTSDKYSFEELRYYEYIMPHENSQMPMYSTLSYRHTEEPGYDTDSSFGQSSISSGGSESNLPNVFSVRKRNTCKLCKHSLVSTNTDSYKKKNLIRLILRDIGIEDIEILMKRICYFCMERHMYCDKNECESCKKIASWLKFQKHRRKHHLQFRKVSMNNDEIYHEMAPENLSNIGMSECVVNLGVRNMACPSPMKAHSLKEHLHAQKKSYGSNNIPCAVLNENIIESLSPASSRNNYANSRVIDDYNPDQKASYSVDKRNIVPSFQPRQLNLSNSSLIERFQDHDIKCLKDVSPKKSHSSPNKVYSSPKIAYSKKKSILSPKKLFLPEEEYYKPIHRSSIKPDEAQTTNTSKNVQRTPRRRLMIGQNLTPSQQYDSHGDDVQSVSSLETPTCIDISLHASSTNDITPNGKLKKRFTMKRSTKRK